LRFPKLAVVAGAAAFCLLNLWVTFHRSLIPVGLNGVVTEIETRFEKDPGTDDVVLIHVDDEAIQVDPQVARRLDEGQRVSKLPFTTAIETSSGYVRLRPSTDFKRMLFVMPAMLALIVYALTRRTTKSALHAPTSRF
jgi:hypothetical protein